MTATATIRSGIFKAAILTTAAAWTLFMAAPFAQGQEAKDARRIVSIGGSVTEIIHDLGLADRLVARDRTSLWPESVTRLPDIGYIRALSPEGVLSVNPDLIIALEGYGPPEAAAVLKQAGVPIVDIPEGYDGDAILAKINAVAKTLGADEAGAALAAKVKGELDQAAQAAEAVSPKRKVLFILSMQGGRIMAAGSDTHANGIITMAGGVNAMASITGYKQVTDEAVIEAAPDVILMMDRTGDHAAKASDVFTHPAIAPTPAASAKSLIKMDGLYLLGFGPRTAAAAMDLGRYLADPKPAMDY